MREGPITIAITFGGNANNMFRNIYTGGHLRQHVGTRCENGRHMWGAALDGVARGMCVYNGLLVNHSKKEGRRQEGGKTKGKLKDIQRKTKGKLMDS